MKIIIVGASQLGRSLAAHLILEKNDVTLIDTNAGLLQDFSQRHDLRTVVGCGSYPAVLDEAGCDEADMIIAVTNSDESNMLACQVAYTLFRTRTKIARLRSREYMRHRSLFAQEALPLDVIISPEDLVSNYVKKLITYPGAVQAVEFADGQVQIVAVHCSPSSSIAGRMVKEIAPDIDFRIIIIYRDQEALVPTGDTRIAANDLVYFIGSPKTIKALFYQLHERERPVRRIIMAGGGHIGMRLGAELEYQYQIKMIETSEQRSKELADYFANVVVLTGSATDAELLAEENIEDTDVFLALTNYDEINLLSAMLAKSLGARRSIVLINQPYMINALPPSAIDVAISPHEVTIGALLTHIRHGDIVRVHSLHGGTAEVMEVIIHGDEKSSHVANHRVADIPMPENTLIGAVRRGKDIFIAHHDLVINAGDHIIVVVIDKKMTAKVEELFQVATSYV